MSRFLQAIAGLAIVAGSFFATLTVMDYLDGAAPAQPTRPGSIKIEEATYGENCPRGVKPGNATPYASKACDGQALCNILISVRDLGDPAQGCAKDFSLRFRCNPESPVRNVRINGEANGRNMRVDCEKPE
jgi:hypothetical protein